MEAYTFFPICYLSTGVVLGPFGGIFWLTVLAIDKIRRGGADESKGATSRLSSAFCMGRRLIKSGNLSVCILGLVFFFNYLTT